MKTLELEKMGLSVLNEKEKLDASGGFFPIAIWVGIGIGLGAVAAYDFICGVYTGIKQELAKN